MEIAKSAALLAGRLSQRATRLNLKILSNKARDLKLQIDIDAEEIIKEHITQKSSLPILAEESGKSGSLDEIFLGSRPFGWNIKFFKKYSNFMCFHMPLMQGLTPILGAIFDFNNSDLYCAHKESKAYVNDMEISVSSLSLKKESTLVTGIPAKDNYSDDEFKNMISDFQSWKKIRMIGSAAMASVYVASGKAEAYKENGIFLWDIAAGAAIVEAAGGKISISNLQPDFRVDANFTNKNLEK